MLLAIDTATQALSIALHDGAALAAEHTLKADRRHSALLAPLIKQMMAQCDVTSGDLSALAVSVGPGSYTGTRIGVAMAKGMAAAAELPLVPVTTLETVLAAQAPPSDDLPLIVTVSAGRDRAIWAEYRCQRDAWVERRAPQIRDWNGLLAATDGRFKLCGEISDSGLEALRRAREGGARIQVAAAGDRLRRAGYVAEIAWQRLRASGRGAFPADEVMPLYIQAPA
ncbi:MAG: tRNA (adenosine(37)-N6)-threonylcarbamoyltransferase complex dimerization subunit type 1 TsaB [Chloroflexi bacterium]|nr:tRNA (adenosine(37)-N6)-threonylcarbamoyltransferase complex dimerization subunit type 1 TsaB [Chloroflexota bacterium]